MEKFKPKIAPPPKNKTTIVPVTYEQQAKPQAG